MIAKNGNPGTTLGRCWGSRGLSKGISLGRRVEKVPGKPLEIPHFRFEPHQPMQVVLYLSDVGCCPYVDSFHWSVGAYVGFYLGFY